MRSEYIDVGERRISQTCNRTAVMQKLPNFIPAFSHHLKPLTRDGSQFTRVLFHPHTDSGVPLDSAVESQQFRAHRRSTFCFRALGLPSTPAREGHRLVMPGGMKRVTPSRVRIVLTLRANRKAPCRSNLHGLSASRDPSAIRRGACCSALPESDRLAGCRRNSPA